MLKPADLLRFTRSAIGARVGAVALLCVATLFINFGDFRYRTSGEIAVPPFGSAAWTIRAGEMPGDEPGTVALSHQPDGRPPYILLQLTPNHVATWMRATFEAKSDGIKAGAPTREARLFFWSFDQNWRRLTYVPHEIAELQGSSGWTSYSLIAPILPTTAHLSVVAINAALAGTLTVRRPRVEIVVETGIYHALRYSLIALWVLAGIWVALPMIATSVRVPSRVPTLISAVVVLLGTLTPYPILGEVTRGGTGGAIAALYAANEALPAAAAMISAILPHGRPTVAQPAETPAPQPQQPSSPADAADAHDGHEAATPSPPPPGSGGEIAAIHAAGARAIMAVSRLVNRDWSDPAHVTGFILFAIAVSLGFRAVPRWQIAAYLILFGAATEAMQSFYFSRDAEFGDLIADATGTVIGLVLVAVAGMGLARTRSSARLGRRGI